VWQLRLMKMRWWSRSGVFRQSISRRSSISVARGPGFD
jgi:hypothetical protein